MVLADASEGMRLVIGNELQKATPTSPPRDIFLKRCTVQRDVPLFSMSPTDAESMARLKALGMTDEDFVYSVKGAKGPLLRWYAQTAELTELFIGKFCAKMKGRYEGWRNAFDQDEIMICDEINAKVQCSTQKPDGTTESTGWVCPATRPGATYVAGTGGALNRASLKTVGYSQVILPAYNVAAAQPFFLTMIKDTDDWSQWSSRTNRMTYAIVPQSQWHTFRDASFDKQTQMDESSLILTDMCTFTDKLNTELIRRMKATGGPAAFQGAAIIANRRLALSKSAAQRDVAVTRDVRHGRDNPRAIMLKAGQFGKPVDTTAKQVKLKPTVTDDKSRAFLTNLKRTAGLNAGFTQCDYTRFNKPVSHDYSYVTL